MRALMIVGGVVIAFLIIYGLVMLVDQLEFKKQQRAIGGQDNEPSPQTKTNKTTTQRSKSNVQ